MYVKRAIRETLDRALGMFPAVLLTGPRQSGKTTFLKEEYGARFGYMSLDDPIERSFAREDPNGFLDRFGDEPIILDELQYAPEILSYIKIRIDRERDRLGRWILTGSQQFQVMKNVSESLAGRIAIFDLLPFALPEHCPKGKRALDELLWVGCYPEPALHPDRRDLWLKAYLETYIQRDVRQLTNVRDLAAFESFLGTLAAHHGQEFNMATLSRRCGISMPTVKAWTGILQASYVVSLLQPYHRNFGKRLVKSPKLYFMDPAIAAYLTRQPGPEAAIAGAMGGALFEGLAIGEALKAFGVLGRRADVSFWRSHDGLEVDLIIQAGGKLLPVEVKQTATPTAGHCKPLERFKALTGGLSADTGWLVCRVSEQRALPHGNMAIPWHQFPYMLHDLLVHGEDAGSG